MSDVNLILGRGGVAHATRNCALVTKCPVQALGRVGQPEDSPG